MIFVIDPGGLLSVALLFVLSVCFGDRAPAWGMAGFEVLRFYCCLS